MCQQRWFSGRMLACHAGGPGSIPGRCSNSFCKNLNQNSKSSNKQHSNEIRLSLAYSKMENI